MELDGGFGWMGGGSTGPSEHVAHLAALERELAAVGLAVPSDFAAFYSSERLCRAFDEVSVTACWTDLSAALRIPAEEGARVVRFMRDQQDCVIWYLHLRPSEEAFVVCSHLELESAETWSAGERADEFREAAAGSLIRCAGSFEEFAYRFVVENELRMQLNSAGAEGQLAPRLQTYVSAYSLKCSARYG
ncbi:hypothetical protein ACH4U5_26935 [Streptomyces sp. NPDC020858]|uniref:hypothetical protein n=1 Tax=Streptomyces sp. NPDC020858 TaxID=3365097 RepID=UPI00378F20F1